MKHFKVTTSYTLEDFEHRRREEDSERFALFNFLVRGMPFTYEYIQTDSTMSLILSNRTWTGPLGMLNWSEVDFDQGAYIPTLEVWNVAASFTYPFFYDDYTFVTRKPRYDPEIMAIFQTLSASVWLSLLVSIILITLVISVTMKYRYTLDDVIFHVLSIGLNQEVFKKAI